MDGSKADLRSGRRWFRRLFAPTAASAQWPVVVSAVGGAGAGYAVGVLVGWERSAVLTGLTGALVSAAGASGPRRLAVRLAVLASVAGFVATVLAVITTGRPWLTAATIALVSVLTSALASAGPAGAQLGVLGMLAYAVSAALELLKHLSAGVSDPGVVVRVATGCVVGVAVVFVAGLVRDRIWYREAEIQFVPSPWRAMWKSIQTFDGYARDGVRRAVALGIGMYLLQRSGTRDALWVFLGVLAVLLPPVERGLSTALVRVAGTLLGVIALQVLALVVNVEVLIALGTLALLPGIAYSRRYPVLAGGLTAFAVVVFTGAPAQAIGTWATHRLWDTALGCALALAAQYLLWPRERSETDGSDPASGPAEDER